MKKHEVRYRPDADGGAPATSLKKDGTSQRARLSEALNAQYFQPEERGTADWLEYARALAATLRYDDGREQALSWEPFLSWRRPAADDSNDKDRDKPVMEEIIRYLEDPATLQHDPAKVAWLSRPHFVLLAVFLKLLQYPKALINTFTQRHLDFYYRDVLQFRRQQAIMDKAHVVAELARGVDQFVLKQGTLLNAGKGPGGEDVSFAVTRDFFLNRARVASLRSVFADKETFSVESLRLKYRDIVSEDLGMWPALKLVYGRPEPGDNMPPYPDGQAVTQKFLDTLANADQQIASATAQLGLNVADFKALMSARAKGDADAWHEVDYWLSEAGKRKKQDPAFSIQGSHALNFQDQLMKAAGVTYPEPFGSLEKYEEWITFLERYFLLPADDAAFLLRIRNVVLDDDRNVKAEEWTKFYALLENAFLQRRISERKEKLHAIRSQAGFDEEDRFMEMMQYALGHPAPGDPLPVYPQSLDEICDDLGREKDSRHEAYLRDELYLDVNDFIFVMALKHGEEAAGQWPRGYAILEQAMRQKRRLGAEKPVKSEWYNLYRSADASWVRTTHEAWRPFGREGAGEKAEVGIAIQHPVLALEEGKRTIVLKLFFESAGFDAERITASLGANPFAIRLSSDGAFFEVPLQNITPARPVPVKEEEKHRWLIAVTVTLDESAPAINAPGTGNEGWDNGHPVAKLVLREQKDGKDDRIPYNLYRNLMLVRVEIGVTVEDIRKIAIENDSGSLNPKKPFEPFDQQPQVGSRFYFFNPEITQKKIDTLSLGFSWVGAPQNMTEHYQGYTQVGERKFTASLLMGGHQGEFVVDAGIMLFSGRQQIGVAAALRKNRVQYEDKTIVREEAGAVPEAERYFMLELNAPDFQHGEFLNLVRQELAVKQPYTPKLKTLTLGYTAGATVAFNGPGCIYHLHPFGVDKLSGSASKGFLPVYDDEGTLLIGVEDLALPGALSLLFRFADGGADPDVAKPAAVFSYLTLGGWRVLNDPMILCDTTDNLSHSGIIQLSIPADATSASTMLPPGKCWIRITVTADSAGINDLLRVEAQGIEAIRAGMVTQASLAAESITATVERMPEVKSLYQPYESFGGRDEEDDTLFYTRISERLRHKQRAVNTWDYERFILQQFPDIYKVKALPHDADHAEVNVIVIPRLRLAQGRNLFQPRLPQHYLRIIQAAVEKITSGFATVRVMNPRYQQVKIRVSVRLKEGYNEAACTHELNLALQKFLSPWAFESQGEITFGGEIYANTVVNFLENHACVAYIIAPKFFVSTDGEDFSFVSQAQGENSILVQAPSQETILVSAAMHEVDIIRDDRYDFDDMRGIGYMKVGLDFKIG